MIAQADALQAGYCGYPLTVDGLQTMTEADYVAHLDGPSPLRAELLCLCARPIVSVTEINADRTRAYASGTIVTAYTVDEQGGLVVLDYGADPWPIGYRAIRVSYRAGYADAPPGLKAITIATVRHLWDRRNVAGQETYNYGGDSSTLSDPGALIPAAAKEALWSYLTPCGRARLLAQQAQEAR